MTRRLHITEVTSMPSDRRPRVLPLAWASLVLLTITANVTPAFAQSTGRGLDIQPGGRQNGLGAAGVALFGDPSDALWWNPAALGFADRTSFQYTHAKLLPGLGDVPYHYVAAAAPLASYGGFGASFTRLDFGEGFGEELSPAFALGVRVHPMVSIGATLKWVDINYGGPTGETFSGDIGALLRLEKEPWTFGFGVMYQNLGGNVDFGDSFGSAPLGRNYKLGGSVTVPVRLDSHVTAGGTAVLDYNKSDVTSVFYTWNGGLEGHVTYDDVLRLAARVGYYDDPAGEIQDFTYGFGIRAWMAAFDAGWIPEERFVDNRVLKITAGMHVDLSTGRPRWRME